MKRQGRDLGAGLIALARRAVAESRAREIILDAIHASAEEARPTFETTVVAAATWPQHPDVGARLQAMSETAEAEMIAGDVALPGPRLLEERSWRRLVARAHQLIEEAARERDGAVADAAVAEKRVADLTAALERRRQALEESRTTAQASSAGDALRVAANVLKPVSRALADSFESGSLTTLQDQLAAMLARARIRPFANAGDIVEFDPLRHVWVGSGSPPNRVVVAPGYATEMEGGGELVLTPARVTSAA